MADGYYLDDDGNYLLDDDGNYIHGEPDDCCCGPECIPGQEPTADFSYEQTNDDPCTIDLFDESTVHSDCIEGTIVERKWYKNDVQFSSDQNPTGIEVEDGDVIRLWVKDSCGCTDEVEGPIECEELAACSECPDTPLPGTCTVKFNDLRTSAGPPSHQGCQCEIVESDVFTLTATGECIYERGCINEPYYKEVLGECAERTGLYYRKQVYLHCLRVEVTATEIVLTGGFEDAEDQDNDGVWGEGGESPTHWTFTYKISRNSEDPCRGVYDLPMFTTSSPLGGAMACDIDGLSSATVTI